MRVLHVDGSRGWGGGQNQIRLLMRWLAKEGVLQSCVCPTGSPLEARLRAEGLPVRSIPWRRGGDPRALLALGPRVRAADIVHAHDSHAFQMVLLPAKLSARPLIATRRVIFRTRASKWNRASRVIAISDAVRARLLRAGVKESLIRTVPSGVDIEEISGCRPPFDLRARLGLGSDVFVAGTVGALLEVKHHEHIVDAATIDAVAWVIVGDGPRRPFLEGRIQQRGARGRVHLAGALHDARAHIRAFDVFVFPSIGEALGTSVLDAMALGVPVVAADSAGPAEVLAPVHARTGNTLVPPMDDTALAIAVERFRSDPALRDRAVAAQQERVQDYTMQKTVERTLALYREVLA